MILVNTIIGEMSDNWNMLRLIRLTVFEVG